MPSRCSSGRPVRRVAVLSWVCFAIAAPAVCLAQKAPAGPEPSSASEASAPATRQPETSAPAQPPQTQQRTTLNLLGQTDSGAGESRRNENIQFNLIDNNALKELNVRIGTTATIHGDFAPDRGYFGAEFGNAPRGTIHLAPAAASRAVHGRLFGSHLNSVFSARSFFQVGEVKPALENDYGFAVTAPAWRSAYLSVAASQNRIRGNVNGNVLVPRPEERTALAADPAVRAVVQRFLDAYPRELPNRTDINPRALNTNSTQRINGSNAQIRLDQGAGPKDRLAFRYQFISQALDAFQLVAGQNPDTDTRSHQARATWGRDWSAASTAEFSLGFDRVGSLLVPEENAVGPYVSVSNALAVLGPVGNIPLDRAQNSYLVSGQWRRVQGAHAWSFGAEGRRYQMNGVETDAHRGFISFGNNFGRDAITNLRLGAPSGGILTIGDSYRAFRNWTARAWLGDRWQAAPALTLNWGVSYSAVTAPVEVERRNMLPYGCDCNNVSPRFGLAWRLPRGWGLVRSAYGVQFGEIFPVTYSQVRFSPPGNRKIEIPTADVTNLGAGFDESDPNLLPALYATDPRLVAPYSHQYNLSWQRELAAGWFVEAGYVGSRSHKLLLMWYLNRSVDVPGIPRTTDTVNLRRADPNFASVRRIVNGSRGYYDAARVSLAVPRWRGVSIDAAYWFSKAIDLGASYTNTAYEGDSRISRSQEEFDQFRDMKGLSDFDQPHALLWRASYAAPRLQTASRAVRAALGGWELSGVVLLKSGTPFTVFSGSDAPGFGNVDANGGDRVDVLDAAVLGRTIGDPDTAPALLPRSAFAFMGLANTRGNIGRNTFRKGPIRNVNAALARRWILAPEKQLLFRAESVNFFNTPQFAEPGFDLANPNFGQITNTLNDGRTFRFLLQVEF